MKADSFRKTRGEFGTLWTLIRNSASRLLLGIKFQVSWSFDVVVF